MTEQRESIDLSLLAYLYPMCRNPVGTQGMVNKRKKRKQMIMIVKAYSYPVSFAMLCYAMLQSKQGI